MVYGLTEEQALLIKQDLEAKLDLELRIVSASGKEDKVLCDVLSLDGEMLYEGREDPRIVMFLRFEGPWIHKALDGFPRIEGGTRPIFCTPTEHNVEWRVRDLIRDLMAEREYFRGQNEAARASGEKGP